MNGIYKASTLTVLMVIALSSCGGGSSSGNNNEPPSEEPFNPVNALSPTRIERAEYDFDNNGIVDGTATYDYYENGLLESINFLYVGDGEFDSYTHIGFQGSSETIINYAYDELGRLTDSTTTIIANTSPDSPIQRQSYTSETSITYEADFFAAKTITLKNFDESGIQRLGITRTNIYNNEGQLTSQQIEEDLTLSDGASYLPLTEVMYQDNLVDIQFYNQLEQFERGITYAINENNLIDRILYRSTPEISSEPENFQAIIDFIYDDAGCLLEETISINVYGDDLVLDKSIYENDEQGRVVKESIALDGNDQIAAEINFFYEDIPGSKQPLYGTPGELLFYKQAQNTPCLYDH